MPANPNDARTERTRTGETETEADAEGELPDRLPRRSVLRAAGAGALWFPGRGAGESAFSSFQTTVGGGGGGGGGDGGRPRPSEAADP